MHFCVTGNAIGPAVSGNFIDRPNSSKCASGKVLPDHVICVVASSMILPCGPVTGTASFFLSIWIVHPALACGRIMVMPSGMMTVIAVVLSPSHPWVTRKAVLNHAPLVAVLGSATICAKAGVRNRENKTTLVTRRRAISSAAHACWLRARLVARPNLLPSRVVRRRGDRIRNTNLPTGFVLSARFPDISRCRL